MSRVLMVFQVRRTRSSRVRKILNIATYASTPSPLRTEQAGMRAILSSAGVRGQFCKETRAVSHGVVNIEEMAKPSGPFRSRLVGHTVLCRAARLW